MQYGAMSSVHIVVGSTVASQPRGGEFDFAHVLPVPAWVPTRHLDFLPHSDPQRGTREQMSGWIIAPH